MSTVDFSSFTNIINGESRNSAETARGIDPFDGKSLWDVPLASKSDMQDAVTAANKALETWSETTIDYRRRLIAQYKDIFFSHLQDFKTLLYKEAGKTSAMADSELTDTISMFDHHLSLNLPTEVLNLEDRVTTSSYVPVGVVVAICPWNFPIVLAMGKVLTGLLTGCTVIVKPSPFTPYSALKLAEIAQGIFPRGVLQALSGDNLLGPSLVAHPDVHKISFTGSTATGKKIMAVAAETVKRVTLEMGGNDATIVLPDVDIAKVAPQVTIAALFHSGQVCLAIKRVYIHQDIYDDFIAAMIETMKILSIGEKDSLLGPIQNKLQFDHIQDLLADSRQQGHSVIGTRHSFDDRGGYFIGPHIVSEPQHDSRIVTEEQFGPIIATLKWSTEDEVVRYANDTKTGLGASVWSSDESRAERIGKRLEAGNIFINSGHRLTAKALFSGHKESGLGGEWGSTGLLEYCNVRVSHVFKTT
ncbi:aldehyde dehydrogenase domain-containing protein [Talaromyces proteolyticus]|uniref:aldehyde dehydrogenase (NAD(+)) n=1 Tax=Talaromyces proteolyticus TaxID=1131652 RepID=A0AAD4Q5M9_9EURO|nr:aldehyde dehydrogenase domain-containing protein [Talaromyces proteolyticus]KAH8704150.1 aldehyde dehydrogenase domain-containing protein [Talaromyces proteolyticus]